ncbi:hypothetical protein ACJIZ3_003211 [Penstemon smallii]|uniref:Uncharacterized protein n=1 Tax=Penstemon smallii TaxID=265156 RepID=A0ABD3UCC9_9LAMI
MSIHLRRNRFIYLFSKNYSFLCNSNVKLFGKPEISSTISHFLVDKHHFCVKAASISTSLNNPQECNSTLTFLKESGFSNTQLEKIVKSWPVVYSANLEKTIIPKIKIFQDSGFSAHETAQIISAAPSILHLGSKNLISSISLLKSLLGSTGQVAKFSQSAVWFLKSDLDKNLVPNINFLQSCGVTMEKIIRLMHFHPRFMLHKTEILEIFVNKAEQMGVGRSSGMFIHAVRVVSSMSNKTWELKLKTLRSLGFSEDDILRVFRQTPSVFGMSEDKMKKVIEVVLSTRKYNMSCLINNSATLMYSVEKRYIPRFRILETLESKNLITKWPSIGSLSGMSDKKFYEKYIGPYLNEEGDIDMTKGVALVGKKGGEQL